MIPDVFGKLQRIRETSRKQYETQEHVRRYMNFGKSGGILEGQWEMQELLAFAKKTIKTNNCLKFPEVLGEFWRIRESSRTKNEI